MLTRLNIRIGLILALVILLGGLTVYLIAPRSMTLPQVSPTLSLNTADEIAIYQSIVRELCFEMRFSRPVVYILRTTNDRAGDRSLEPHAAPISESVQTGITIALVALPNKIIWISDMSEVIHNERVDNRGMMITLGNIHFENSDKALVSGSGYSGVLSAFGATYIVERRGGVWVVVGDNGTRWIS